MLQIGDRVEFSFWEAGCLIWVGAWEAYPFFYQAWDLSEIEKIRQLILEDHAIMPLSLYQDDGYYTRVVMGELNEREQEDWTARSQWQLTLPSGKLVVSGIVDEEEDIPALADAVPHDTLQLYVEVPPGQYVVTLYAYPPGDLSTGWGQIEANGLFPPSPGIEPENPLLYFQRTRPGEAIPDWLGANYAPTEAERKQYFDRFYAGTDYVNFVVQLLPLADESSAETRPIPTIDAEGCLSWEFRKPDRCPLGVLAKSTNH